MLKKTFLTKFVVKEVLKILQVNTFENISTQD